MYRVDDEAMQSLFVERGVSCVHTLQEGDLTVTTGLAVLSGTILCQVYRLHDDTQKAFLTAFKSQDAIR